MGLLLVVYFIVGIVCGFLLTMIAGIIYAKRTLASRKETVDKFVEEFNKLSGNLEEKVSSVETRLARVKEIITEQLELSAQTDGPQKNAMDGKYKNRVNNSVKSLEEEKHDIFRSIIADGFDPKVSVLGSDGTVQSMKLSEFMVEYGIAMDSKPEDKSAAATAAKTKSKKSPSKAGKFIVYEGGKDDGGEGTSH